MAAIVGLLVLVVLPQFIEARTNALAGEIAEEFRSMGAGFHAYKIEHHEWPTTLPPGAPPPEMENRLSEFESGSSVIGGQWQWEHHPDEGKAYLCLVNFKERKSVIQRLDKLLDDGDLSTGSLRLQPNRLMLALR